MWETAPCLIDDCLLGGDYPGVLRRHCDVGDHAADGDGGKSARYVLVSLFRKKKRTNVKKNSSSTDSNSVVSTSVVADATNFSLYNFLKKSVSGLK